ncbi:hypothetical protein [Actibacterium sp. 188UL27-1]|uniref:hypothetical protein n=1 Tax=Actibacterium sp. 188UL27-1 TaxID=2786961 RepID=UPI00195D86F2|nr:hypothetical protein [Actibacterium sp. 188UL27-1]MBM7067191.1 hypothetical protein [Actibacterium sp. 188UL27-1]
MRAFIMPYIEVIRPIPAVAWIPLSILMWPTEESSSIWEEWLIEIGRMNYDYGTGISEWSLNVVPARLLVLAILGPWSRSASRSWGATHAAPAHRRRSGQRQGRAPSWSR